MGKKMGAGKTARQKRAGQSLRESTEFGKKWLSQNGCTQSVKKGTGGLLPVGEKTLRGKKTTGGKGAAPAHKPFGSPRELSALSGGIEGVRKWNLDNAGSHEEKGGLRK